MQYYTFVTYMMCTCITPFQGNDYSGCAGQNLLQDIPFLDEAGKNHYQKVLAESEFVLADDLADEVSRQRKARRKKGHESGKR